VKGAFIVGAEGGRGVLLVHNADGTWSDPAFYFMGSASFGLQIGGKASSVVLIVNTQGGLDKIMSNSVKLGADLSVAAGPVGTGAQAAPTTNVGADLYQYALRSCAF
jgi:lipid-binding SYLF domain-containing protein